MLFTMDSKEFQVPGLVRARRDAVPRVPRVRRVAEVYSFEGV